MSFILDALKKSEAERRRQTGPTLYEMRAAPRRSTLPTGVVVLLVVLALNLVLLGYLLLRKPAVTPAAATPVVEGAAPPVSPPPAATVTASPHDVAAPPMAATGPYRAPAQPPMPEPVFAAPESPQAPRSLPPATPDTHPQGTGPVASLADMRAGNSGLPDLRLSLHVYDPEPARRYLLLNGMRLREGDALPDGLRLERITEDGAILVWRNRRFLMQRGE
ncbi:MAG: hypothetical protein RLZZ200_140 [Pseudomonadota bacterium]|jgi:general secretion pathway protein B